MQIQLKQRTTSFFSNRVFLKTIHFVHNLSQRSINCVKQAKRPKERNCFESVAI